MVNKLPRGQLRCRQPSSIIRATNEGVSWKTLKVPDPRVGDPGSFPESLKESRHHPGKTEDTVYADS